jgi:DNA invertase Pin-like site-specific DNA recombinase
MELVAYVRVSLETENPENQEYAINQWLSEYWHRVIETVRDVGVSGALPPLSRPGWRRVINLLVQGNAQGVVVYALDRVARSLWDMAEVFREFEKNNWVIFSVREEWLNALDPTFRKFAVAMLGWAGEVERKFISERTKEAMRKMKAEGKHVGRPPKWNDNVRKRALALIEQCYRLSEVAKIIGVAPKTLQKHLAYDPEYMDAKIRCMKKKYMMRKTTGNSNSENT